MYSAARSQSRIIENRPGTGYLDKPDTGYPARKHYEPIPAIATATVM